MKQKTPAAILYVLKSTHPFREVINESRYNWPCKCNIKIGVNPLVKLFTANPNYLQAHIQK